MASSNRSGSDKTTSRNTTAARSSDKAKRKPGQTTVVNPCLVVLTGAQMGRVIRVPPTGAVTIGRSKKATLRMDDDAVSRQHTSIAMKDNEAIVRDLGSRNGTFVNQRQIEEWVLIPGDRIEIGDELVLKFMTEDDLRIQGRKAEDGTQRDKLTGLLSREAFMEKLATAVATASSQAQPLALLMIGVDHIEQVNTDYGRIGGHHVLRLVADVMRQSTRDGDVLGRLQGDRFVVAAHQDLPGGDRIAERIRQAAENTSAAIGKRKFGITVSVGVASGLVGKGADAGDFATTLLSAAEEALAQAKQQGRNLVRHHPLDKPSR